MAESNQQKIQALREKIKFCRSCIGLCGSFLLFSIASVFLSILLGNRTLGLCGISWILASLLASVACGAESRRNELEGEIYAIESLSQAEAALSNGAHRSVETGFGFIGMN